MLRSTKNVLGLVLAITSTVILFAAHTASGAAIVWDGAANNDWDTTTVNWSGSTYTDGDDVTFSAAAGGIINLTANRAPGSTVVSAASGTYTFSGSAITSGTLTKSGGGTLVLNSPYSGGTITNNDTAGKIVWGASDLIADNVRLIGVTGGGATWDMAGFSDAIRGINRPVHIINMGDLTYTVGDDTWGGGTISGSGALIFAPTHGTTSWGPKATHTGGTFIRGGTVGLYGNTVNAFPVTGEVTVDTGTTWSLNLHNNTPKQQMIGGLFGSGTVKSSNNNLVNTNFQVGNGGGTSTFDGVYEGAGRFTKLGAGTLTLNGNNTYTGTTDIEGGLLLVNGVTGLGQDDYTVKTGAILGGSGTINLAVGKTLTVQSGGSIAPGTSPGTLTLNGDLTLLDGSFLNIEIGSISDLLVVNGLLTGATSVGGVTVDITNLGDAGDAPIVFVDWSGGSEFGVELSDFQLLNPASGELSIVGSQLLFTQAVPEPSSLLSLAALMCLGAMRRRRRRA